MVNKKNFKIISIITTLFVISTLISFNTKKAKANSVATQPNFKITELKAAPDPAKVGEDILVSGKIVPEDFETTVAPKEIVLVLDVSGSMKEEIILEDKCKETRTRYCISHNSDILNHTGRGKHDWIDDYCSLDHKQGEHNTNIKSTKIEELKKAAKAFIDTMKDVSNLKIGVVAYSSIATINPYKTNGSKYINTIDNTFLHAVNNYTSFESNFLKSNDSRLKTIIDILNPLGGTNTGEGLRKAIYMLENGDKSSSKTIVLMSDGLPTFYSVEDKNKKEYTQINNTNPEITGEGSGVDNKSINYAKNIGKKVDDNNYNAFSIGYGLDSSGKEYLKQIHSAMKGLKDWNEANETNGFFAKSDGSITEIFNQIAENIKSSYELKQVSLDIGLTEGFTLNIGGNEIKMGNIVYNKVSEDKNTGKIRYHAEPVNFSFIVKGKQEGYQQIFNNIKINYLWEDTIKSIDINEGVSVTISPNELPSISAKLLSNDKIEIKKDDEITLKYEITPEDFIYNSVSNSGEKDVLFLIDSSMGSYDTTKNVLEKIHAEILQKLDSKTKYAAITFNSTSDILFDFNYIGDKDSGSYANSINERKFKQIKYDNYERNLGKAFNLVEEIFKVGRATASKNIVIISNDDVKCTDSDYNKIKGKNYNIITISYQYKNTESRLYEIHKLIEGKEDSIIFPTSNLNDVWNYSPGYAREKLESFSLIKPYLINPVLNLNLGNSFEPVSGIIKSTESGKNNIGVVEIPTITYNLTQNNNYHADSQIIEIKIKANNLSPDTYTFGNSTDNKMIYKTILNKDVSMTIKTPIITVKEEVKNISHGLYNGINKGQISIQENNKENPFEIAQGSTVTFGAIFTFSGSSIDFDLNIDNKFSALNLNDIKIYKVSKDSLGNSTLEELKDTNKSISPSEGNKFKISINNMTDSSTEILVVYQGKIIDSTASGQALTNEIVFSSASKNATIVTPQQSNNSPILPDLF